jgi:hypothetical protein
MYLVNNPHVAMLVVQRHTNASYAKCRDSDAKVTASGYHFPDVDRRDLACDEGAFAAIIFPGTAVVYAFESGTSRHTDVQTLDRLGRLTPIFIAIKVHLASVAFPLAIADIRATALC